MKKLTLSLAIASLSAVPALASAQSYQAEGNFNYSNVDFDQAGASSKDVYEAEGIFYFDPVSTRGAPLAEAAFLDRASNAFADYRYDDQRPYQSTIRAGAEFYQENFYGRAEVNQVENSGGQESSNTGAVLTAGFMALDGLRFTAGYAFEDPEFAQEDVVSIGAKYVDRLHSDQAVSLTADVDFADDDVDTVVTDVRGDFFITDETSVGLGIAHTDNDIDDNTAVTLGGEHFFTPLVSGSIDYTFDESVDNNPQGEADTLRLGLTARF